MSYKKATELSPSLFKRRYGVSLKTFWKMVEVVRNAKQGSRGSHAKLSIPTKFCWLYSIGGSTEPTFT
jgi:hypothetical protein